MNADKTGGLDVVRRQGTYRCGVWWPREILLSLLLCCVFTAQLYAEGGIGSAVPVGKPIGASEAVLFDGKQYRVGSRKARASFTLPEDQLYAIVKPMELNPVFDFTESLSPARVRSFILGDELGVLVRYGMRTYVDPGAHALASERAIGNFRILERSQYARSDRWGDAGNDFIFYRQGLAARPARGRA